MWYSIDNKDYTGFDLLRVVQRSRHCEEFSLFALMSASTIYAAGDDLESQAYSGERSGFA